MNEEFLAQYLSRIKAIQLSQAKKEKFREELVLAMLRQPILYRVSISDTISDFFGFFHARRVMFSSVVAGVVVLIFGTGISLAAERSLPGDTLYSVKTGMNERVRETFAWTPEAKADWEVRLVERRIAEADVLSLEGRLDEESRSLIEGEATRHARSIGDLVEKFDTNESEKAEEIREHLSSVLQGGVHVQAEVLRKKVIISEREEGNHDEEDESYDDDESDMREQETSIHSENEEDQEYDQQEKNQNESVIKNNITEKRNSTIRNKKAVSNEKDTFEIEKKREDVVDINTSEHESSENRSLHEDENRLEEKDESSNGIY